MSGRDSEDDHDVVDRSRHDVPVTSTGRVTHANTLNDSTERIGRGGGSDRRAPTSIPAYEQAALPQAGLNTGGCELRVPPRARSAQDTGALCFRTIWLWLRGRDLPPRAAAAGFGRAAHKTAHATKTNVVRIGCGGSQPSGLEFTWAAA